MTHLKKSSGAAAALLSAILIFGTVGILKHYIPLPAALVALIRGLLGSLFLILFMLVTKKRFSFKAAKEDLPVLLLSGGCIGVNWLLLFEAVDISVSVGTLCYYTAPIFVILFSPLLLKEKLTPVKLVAVFVALGGMLLVSGVFESGKGAGLPCVLYGLGAALLYASVMILNKKLKRVSAYERTVVQLLAASLVLLPFCLFGGEFKELSSCGATDWILLAVIGIVHTGLAYALYFGSMMHLPGQTVALLSYLDPATAILWAALLLSEIPSPLTAVGAVLVIGAAMAGELLPGVLQKKKKDAK
jgi:RarD protein